MFFVQVVSGGVACNKYIQRAVGIVCQELDYRIQVPPPQLCTDNGIMIAWNGMERWMAGEGIYQHDNLDCLDIEAKWVHKVTDLVRDWYTLTLLSLITLKQVIYVNQKNLDCFQFWLKISAVI